MSVSRIRKLLYRFGLLTPFWGVDRFRYIKRLSRKQLDDWRYASAADAQQFTGGEVVARITGIAPPVFLYCDRRSVIEAEVIKKGAFQPHILALGNDLILPGSIVIDVGANIGAYALPWAACNKDSNVYCFEPHPQVRARLTRNLELNRFISGRVTICAEALSDRIGRASLQAVRQEGGNLGLSALANQGILSVAHSDLIEVPMVRLDDVFADEARTISLLKVDVQGHELEVLRGGAEMLARHRPTLILEHEDGLFATAEEAADRRAMTGKLLSELGYETLYISHWGADLLTRVDWSRALNGDLLALPLERIAEVSG